MYWSMLTVYYNHIVDQIIVLLMFYNQLFLFVHQLYLYTFHLPSDEYHTKMVDL